MIATDHAPHTRTAKEVEFDYAPCGIIGLETAFSVCYTELVKKQVINLPRLIQKMTTGPADVLGIAGYDMASGKAADFVVIDPEAEYVIDKNTFKSKSRNTPFDGRKVSGKVIMTAVGGKIVFRV